MHYFIDHTQLTDQAATGIPYGTDSIDPTNKFNITSRFQLTGEAKAFACQDSLMIVQQSSVNSSLVNVILKPIEGLKVPFRSVKYYVYRGLLKNSFISGTAITPQTSTNSEFIARCWTDWNNYKTNTNQPTLTDPTPQTFGYDNTLSGTLNIENIYDNSQTEVRALFVKEGDWIGDFGSFFKIGFEIITEDDNLTINLDFLRAEKHQIDVSGFFATAFEKRAIREQILSFIDPAAFFGLHYDSGVNISVYSGNIKTTVKKKQNDIYLFLLDNKFATKNRVYLDIRSEKGFSYNFYQNYDDGSAKNIKIGNSSTTPVVQNYSTNDWPIVFVDSPITTTANINDIKINLRIDDNIKPILFFENTDLLGTNNRSRFLRENEILNGTAIDWSKDLTFKFPNTGTGSAKDNLAYYININYFRQEFNPASPNTIWKNEKYFDNLFGHLSPKIFDASNVFRWVPFNELVHTAGNLPQLTDSFGSVGSSGCYFDSDSVVFYLESLFSYESAREPFPLLTASIVFDNPFFKNIRANNLVVNYDLFLDPETNDEITAINIDKYDSIPFFKENLFFVILKKNEFDTLNALTGFSTIANLKRYISFEQITDSPTVDYLTDLNGNKFYKYKLKVAGFDSSGIYHEEYPTNDLIVYSGDGLAFASISAVQTKITKGAAWAHQHLWNDTVTNQSHISKFGSDYFAGMKYKDGLPFRIKPILENRLKKSQVNNTKIDCADLCLSVLVEYASFYGLPLLFDDYREIKTSPNRRLNSKNTQYKSTSEFDLALRKTYGAATLFSEFNLFIEDVAWNNIRPSDMMTWRSNTIIIIHPNQTFHANTITELSNDSITVIQGSLEDEQPTPIEKRIYDRDTDGSVDPGFWKAWFVYGGSGSIKARRWKFNVFDNA
jgi:hypothetical protein